jgi:hypothetical protein
VVARHAGAGHTGIPTLACDASGSLLFVWGQAKSLPDPDARPIVQSRQRLRGIRTDGSRRWSEPFLLAPEIPEARHMGLPALACNGQTWWLLTYLADDKTTEVTLLRSDDGRQFAVDRTLATRKLPLDEISLHGSYLLHLCDDVAHPGDYVGLDAVGDRVVAAFGLPEHDRPNSRATVQVAVIDP